MENEEQWIRSFYQSDCGCSLDDLCGRHFWRQFLKGCIYQEDLDEAFYMSSFWGLLFCGKSGIGKSALAQAFLGELENNGYQLIYLRTEEILKNSTEALQRAEWLKMECIKWGKTVICLEDAEVLREETAVAERLAEGIDFLRQNNSPCIWILVTEKENDIPKILRKQLEICRLELPTMDERTEYFQRVFEPLGRKWGVFRYRQMAELTETFDFRQLRQTTVLFKALLKQDLLEQYDNDWTDVERLAKAGELPMKEELFCRAVEQVREKITEEKNSQESVQSVQMFLGELLSGLHLQSGSGYAAEVGEKGYRTYPKTGEEGMRAGNENGSGDQENVGMAEMFHEEKNSENWLDEELAEMDPSTLD